MSSYSLACQTTKSRLIPGNRVIAGTKMRIAASAKPAVNTAQQRATIPIRGLPRRLKSKDERLDSTSTLQGHWAWLQRWLHIIKQGKQHRIMSGRVVADWLFNTQRSKMHRSVPNQLDHHTCHHCAHTLSFPSSWLAFTLYSEVYLKSNLQQ